MDQQPNNEQLAALRYRRAQLVAEIFARNEIGSDCAGPKKSLIDVDNQILAIDSTTLREEISTAERK